MRTRLVAAVGLLALVLPTAPVRASGSDAFRAYTHRTAEGSLPYKLFTPGGRPRLLVVVLPGAGETSDVAATRSRWNEVASRFRFAVAYPQQNPDYNSNLEWDWAAASREGRANREASLVAGLTRAVVARERLDPRQVYVMGFSAGAGMASAMAVSFPDVYRALGLEAGCPFDAVRCGGSSLTAQQSAAAALTAMGRHRRVVPVFNEYGSADEIALGVGSDQVVPSWLTVADTLDDGRDDGTVPRAPAERRTVLPALPQKPYTVSVFRDRRGCTLAEEWVVHGESHAWAGGAPTGPWDVTADPLAPDVTTAMYRFFQRSGQCQVPRRSGS